LRFTAFKRFLRSIRSFDLIIVSGGGQLDDFWGGSFGHPLLMLTWSIMARLNGVKFAFVGVGMDRLSSSLTRLMTLIALRLAHYRCFRDKGTLSALNSIGMRWPSHVCPDLAFSLGSDMINKPQSSDSIPFIAVNPISYKTWTQRKGTSHNAYLKNLALACKWALDQGIHIRIVCTQSKMDMATAFDLLAMLKSQYPDRVQICGSSDVSTFIVNVANARVVIASRLHGAILSLLAGAPVIAISPIRKVAQLMTDVGMEDFNLTLFDFESDELIDRIEQALKQGEKLKAHIRERLRKFRDTLSKTYDDVLALL
jgi:polysaccharide pyruvyl transferase WcaK-like protein